MMMKFSGCQSPLLQHLPPDRKNLTTVKSQNVKIYACLQCAEMLVFVYDRGALSGLV